jgi:hypothetical protein
MPNEPEMTDERAIDVIALGLGAEAEWSSEDLEWIADVIGWVRPHPGNTKGDYVIAFEDATSRDAEDFIELDIDEIRSMDIEVGDTIREEGMDGWHTVTKRDDHGDTVLVWCSDGSQFAIDQDTGVDRRS